jgi:hypothetical protein
MSGCASERAISLSKVLSRLREVDRDYEGSSKTESERDAHRFRQQRHHEIGKEIKALEEQKKNDLNNRQVSDSGCVQVPIQRENEARNTETQGRATGASR